MNKFIRKYGEWLSTFNWSFIATIRRNYRLTEFNIRNMIMRLFRQVNIKTIFYVIEPDRYDNMTHVHLLIKIDSPYNSKSCARDLGINPKSINYFEKVNNCEAVSIYCSKYIAEGCLDYDLLVK